MGSVSESDLDTLPFTCFETLNGVYDSREKRFLRSAMLGFEADTTFRAFWCRVWNRLNLLVAGSSKTIRLAIHPQDFKLRLAGDLEQLLQQGGIALSYSHRN